VNDFTKGLNDLIDVITRPLFTLGSTGVSIGRLIVAVALTLAVLWLSRFSERALQRLAAHRPQQFSVASAHALGRISRYVLLVLGIIIALSVSGFNISALAVVGGGLGIGVGLGLQTLFANFVSGIVLLLDRSLKVGDFVDLQSGVRGSVVEIAIRYTQISTNDSVDVLVPNSEFVNGRVANWSFHDTSRRIHIPFTVAYGTDKSLVREAGLAAVEHIEGVIASCQPRNDSFSA
jgi:small-conductance mechanosensitive channel